MVIYLERGADLHMAQLMPLPLTVSCFSKMQIGFTFLVPAHLGSPGKRAVKRVCVFMPELSTGPFCVTRSNPTDQLTDPTQPNPLQMEKFEPNPTQPYRNCASISHRFRDIAGYLSNVADFNPPHLHLAPRRG